MWCVFVSAHFCVSLFVGCVRVCVSLCVCICVCGVYMCVHVVCVHVHVCTGMSCPKWLLLLFSLPSTSVTCAPVGCVMSV